MMRKEIIIPRPSERETEVIDSGGDDSAAQSNPLLQQAAEYVKIARAALEDCQRGEKAELELLQRRNRSGQ